jgi:hypothetical protein
MKELYEFELEIGKKMYFRPMETGYYIIKNISADFCEKVLFLKGSYQLMLLKNESEKIYLKKRKIKI